MALNLDPKNGDFQKLTEQLASKAQSPSEPEPSSTPHTGPTVRQDRPQGRLRSKENQPHHSQPDPRQFSKQVSNKLNFSQILVSVMFSFTMALILSFLITLGLIGALDIYLPVYGICSLWAIWAMLLYSFCVSRLRKINQERQLLLLKSQQARQGQGGQGTQGLRGAKVVMPPLQSTLQTPNGTQAQSAASTNSFLLDQRQKLGISNRPSMVLWIGLAILIIVLMIVGAPFAVVVMGMFLNANKLLFAVLTVVGFLCLVVLLALVVRFVNRSKGNF